MENSPQSLLADGLKAVGVDVAAAVQERLWSYAVTLLKWNEKVNLTAITKPSEVVEKHLVDSLAVWHEVVGESVLDLGAGAGLPGIPLAIARPELRVTLVDTVGKKVAFMKSAIAGAGLTGRVRAVHARAEGAPQAEGLDRAQVLISRAFMDVGPWLLLAKHYVLPGGRVVAMLGQTPAETQLRQHAQEAGLTLVTRRTYELPFSGDPRGVAVFAAP